MRTYRAERGKERAEARAGYSIAGAGLLAVPALVVLREGAAGLTAGVVVPALVGIGFFVAAMLAGRIGRI